MRYTQIYIIYNIYQKKSDPGDLEPMDTQREREENNVLGREQNSRAMNCSTTTGLKKSKQNKNKKQLNITVCYRFTPHRRERRTFFF